MTEEGSYDVVEGQGEEETVDLEAFAVVDKDGAGAAIWKGNAVASSATGGR